MAISLKGPVKRRYVSALAILVLLGGCATAPRGPAATLATAGLTSTDALARDYRSTASGLRDATVSDAFVDTFELCADEPENCRSMLPGDEKRTELQLLAHSVELRGRATEALGKAYGALKTEAEYDAKGDVRSATNHAIEALNDLTISLFALPGVAGSPAGKLIETPLEKILVLGAGLLADRSQAKRLRAGSAEIRKATVRLHDALSAEAWVFDTLTDYLVMKRTAAKRSLLEAGLASHQSVITPMIESLALKPAEAMEATIRKSEPSQAAIRAVVEARARNEVAETQAKYKAAIKALEELIEAHGEFEEKRPLSLADLERFLSELNTAIDTSKKGAQ